MFAKAPGSRSHVFIILLLKKNDITNGLDRVLARFLRFQHEHPQTDHAWTPKKK